MKLAKLSQPMILLSAAYKPLETEIPVKYCIIKNCHNCYRMFHFNFGTEVSRRVCTTMYHQAGCCDFYIKRTKGTLFWSTVSRTHTVSARSQIVDPKIQVVYVQNEPRIKTFQNCLLHLDLFVIKYKLHFRKYHFHFHQMLLHECFPIQCKLCQFRHMCHHHPMGQYMHIDKEAEYNQRPLEHMYQLLDRKSRLILGFWWSGPEIPDLGRRKKVKNQTKQCWLPPALSMVADIVDMSTSLP